jgi:hypothetical protein
MLTQHICEKAQRLGRQLQRGPLHRPAFIIDQANALGTRVIQGGHQAALGHLGQFGISFRWNGFDEFLSGHDRRVSRGVDTIHMVRPKRNRCGY